MTPQSSTWKTWRIDYKLLKGQADFSPDVPNYCMRGMLYVAYAMLQTGKSYEAHAHGDHEEVYYIIAGHGTMTMMREAATYMANQGTRGNIINISSTRGLSAHPGDAIYGGIKAALNRIVQSVALDVASYGIRANNILPGATKRFTPEEEAKTDPAHLEKVAYLSQRIPLERYGTPEDVGNLVVFLASDKASYITGQSIAIDGGLSLPGLAETAAETAASGWGRVKKEIRWQDA